MFLANLLQQVSPANSGNNIKEWSHKTWSLCLISLIPVIGLIWKITYNILLHPLSPVPGPQLAKVFGGYLLPAQAKFCRAQTLRQLHKQYGLVVRIGPNEVSISDWSVYREIYGGKESTKTKHFYEGTTLTGRNLNIFAITNKQEHSGRRKLQNHSYSQQTVLQNEALISDKADILVRRIAQAARRSPSGSTAEVYELCGLFSLEVILKCAFNRNYGESPSGDSLTLLKATETGIVAGIFHSVFPFVTHKLGSCIPGYLGHCFQQMALWERMTKELYDQFQQDEATGDTSQRFMLTPMLVNDDAYLGRRLTQDELLEELMGLTFAGSGTTSTTLTYLIYSLARDHTAQARLRQELQTAGGSLGELQGLRFLSAVIKETMRLYPTIISTLPRVLDGPLTVDKYLLPPGTLIGMQNYVHQRDSTIFLNPDEFLPDRWLRADDVKAKDINSALTPFSVGSRNCIGQNLARAELYLAASKIFSKFRLSLNHDMEECDMEMEDRFAVAPKGRKLLVDIEYLGESLQ